MFGCFAELIESAMYLYRATRDPTLLELGRDAVESIEKISKVDCGFATVSTKSSAMAAEGLLKISFQKMFSWVMFCHWVKQSFWAKHKFFSNKALLFVCEAALVIAGHVSGHSFFTVGQILSWAVAPKPKWESTRSFSCISRRFCTRTGKLSCRLLLPGVWFCFPTMPWKSGHTHKKCSEQFL